MILVLLRKVFDFEEVFEGFLPSLCLRGQRQLITSTKSETLRSDNFLS